MLVLESTTVMKYILIFALTIFFLHAHIYNLTFNLHNFSACILLLHVYELKLSYLKNALKFWPLSL